MSEKRDIDYLAISARIRAMENDLLTQAKMDQLIDAANDDEINKILSDCGWPALDAQHPDVMDAAISAQRQATLEDLTQGVPDAGFVDIYKLKNDYHNIKTVLKAMITENDPDPLLIDAGRVPAKELKDAIISGDLSKLPALLSDAAAEAKEILQTTRDPQLSDIALDRWTFADMLSVAQKSDSEFLKGYVRVQIDALNLQTVVRTLRMGKNVEFLQNVLIDGGDTGIDDLLSVASSGGSGLTELFAPTLLGAAAGEGVNVIAGESFADFERLCDDGVSEYLQKAQMVPFGEEVLIGYLSARETEYSNLRIILMGRKAGLDAETIRARLRRSYI